MRTLLPLLAADFAAVLTFFPLAAAIAAIDIGHSALCTSPQRHLRVLPRSSLIHDGRHDWPPASADAPAPAAFDTPRHRRQPFAAIDIEGAARH